MEDIGMSQYVYPIKEKNFSEAYSKGYSYFRENDILLAKVTPCFENGKSGIAKKLKNGIGFGTTEIHIIRCSEKVIPEFIHLLIVSEDFMKQGKLQMTGTGGLQRLPAKFVENFKFPLPSLAEQKKITAQFSEEQEIINANKRLIEIMKGKIERVINNLLY
jgi:restriction endonuclease S subunit